MQSTARPVILMLANYPVAVERMGNVMKDITGWKCQRAQWHVTGGDCTLWWMTFLPINKECHWLELIVWDGHQEGARIHDTSPVGFLLKVSPSRGLIQRDTITFKEEKANGDIALLLHHAINANTSMNPKETRISSLRCSVRHSCQRRLFVNISHRSQILGTFSLK